MHDSDDRRGAGPAGRAARDDRLRRAAATDGERLVQDVYGTADRAARFYRDQVRAELTDEMIAFLAAQTQFVLATADSEGVPDASVRFGDPGFVAVASRRTIAWPEMRGNGVMTSLGNILKNPSAHLMFLDHVERIGLHVRGDATIVEHDIMKHDLAEVVRRTPLPREPERWVLLNVQRCYVHCRKHFPRDGGPVEWGTDDVRSKGGDYFGTKATRPPW